MSRVPAGPSCFPGLSSRSSDSLPGAGSSPRGPRQPWSAAPSHGTQGAQAGQGSSPVSQVTEGRSRHHQRPQGLILLSLPTCFDSVTPLVQMVKNLPARQETLVRSLGWEDALEKGMATHSSVLTWGTPWTVAHGVAKSRTRLRDFPSVTPIDLPTVVAPDWGWGDKECRPRAPRPQGTPGGAGPAPCPCLEGAGAFQGKTPPNQIFRYIPFFFFFSYS